MNTPSCFEFAAGRQFEWWGRRWTGTQTRTEPVRQVRMQACDDPGVILWMDVDTLAVGLAVGTVRVVDLQDGDPRR